MTRAVRPGKWESVNPVVAVFLGWIIAAEETTARTIATAAIIIVSVVLISERRES